MRSVGKFIRSHKQTLYALFAVFLFSTTVTFAVPPSTPYNAGQTLDPACAPGSSNCSVAASLSTASADARYPQLSGSYANPSWIASLPFTKITNTPTTLAGYGIADAYTKTQSDANYFGLTGGTFSGTGGAGFLGLTPQSVAPTAPTSGVRLYARSTGALSWIGTNGFTRSFSGAGLTGDRTYTLPDADVALVGDSNAQTISGLKTFSTAPAFSAFTQGAIPFIGTSGILSQDVSGLYYDASNKRLGLGTTTPAEAVSVVGNADVTGTLKRSGREFTLRERNAPLANWFYGGVSMKKILMVGDTTSDLDGNALFLKNQLAVYQQPGRSLAGTTIVNFGSSSSFTTQQFIDNTGPKGLAAAIAARGDLYVISYGLVDVDSENATQQQVSDRLRVVVNAIRAQVPDADIVLRMPNSLLLTDGSSQTKTDNLRNAYLSLDGVWPNVTLFSTQPSIFSETSPVSSPLMSDNTRPSNLGYRTIADGLVQIIGSSTTGSQWISSTTDTSIYYLNGNVGIGTNAPASPLSVAATVGGNGFSTPFTIANITAQLSGFPASALTNTLVNIVPTYNGWSNGNNAKLVGINVDLSGDVSGNRYTALFQGGNVGINNNAPAYSLDVTGAIAQRPAAAITLNNYLRTNAAQTNSTTSLNAGVLLYESAENTYGMDMGYNGTRYRTRIFAPAAGDIAFSRNSVAPTAQSAFTDAMVIRGDTGNVGIGIAAPTSRFNVAGNLSSASWTTAGVAIATNAATYTDTSSAESATVVTRAVNSFGIPTLTSTNNITVGTASTVYIAGVPVAGTGTTITSPLALHVGAGNAGFAGNIGIGINSPTARLHINGGLSVPSWTTTGVVIAAANATYTDNSSAASATVATRAASSLGIPTLASTNAITVTDASTLYIAGAPFAGTNTTITNSFGLHVLGNTYLNGSVGIGTRPTGRLTVGGAMSAASWTTSGISISTVASTYTDTTSVDASTVATRVVNSLAAPTLASTNAITVTEASTLYIAAAPIAGTNTTITNQLALRVASGNVLFGAALGVGSSAAPVSTLTLAGARTAAAWGTNGIGLQVVGAIYTDNSTAVSGTATNAMVSSFAIPTINTTNATTTITNAATVYVAGAPINGANTTITNKYALFVAAGLSQFGTSAVTTGTTVATFTNAGGTCNIVPSTSGGITCSSDMTLKKNIVNLDDSAWNFNNNITTENQSVLAKILALSPVDYNWNIELDTDPKHAGFIAQEVKQLFPDLVSEDQKTHLLSLNYAGFMPYTVQAIKEMDMNITSISNLDRDNTWRSSLIAWFGSTKNGITNIFSKKVTTDELCVGTACVTQEQFLQMIQQNSSNGTTTVYGPGPEEPAAETPADPAPEPSTQTPAVTEPEVEAPAPAEEEEVVPPPPAETPAPEAPAAE